MEPKNLVRQNFTEADLGENKARVIAERYSDVFGLETSYIPRFIEDAGQLEELLTAAAGLYYLGFGSNYINEQQERQILSNPEAYALCVAELQPVEEAAR